MKILQYNPPSEGDVQPLLEAREKTQMEQAMEKPVEKPGKRINRYKNIIRAHQQYPFRTVRELAEVLGPGYSRQYISQSLHRYRRKIAEQQEKEKTEQIRGQRCETGNGVLTTEQVRETVVEAVDYITNLSQGQKLPYQGPVGEQGRIQQLLLLLGRVLLHQIVHGYVDYSKIRTFIFNTVELRTEADYHLFIEMVGDKSNATYQKIMGVKDGTNG